MIELTEKRMQYSIKDSNDSISLSGRVTLDDNKRITDFNGQFYDTDKNYIGSFFYNESEAGKSNKNLSDMTIDSQKLACDLLDSTIVELKNVNE